MPGIFLHFSGCMRQLSTYITEHCRNCIKSQASLPPRKSLIPSKMEDIVQQLRRLAMLLLLSSCLGCSVHIPQTKNPRTPIALSDIISTLTTVTTFDHVVRRSKFTKDLLEDHDDYILYACKVLSDSTHNFLRGPKRTYFPDDALSFKYFKSNIKPNIKHPVIILYNILKDKNETVTHTLADILLEQGYDCIIIQQEWFLSGRWLRPVTPYSDCNNPRLSYDEYNAQLARNVSRIVKNWIPEQRSLDGRFGFVGVSFGGLYAVGAAAIFPNATLTVTIMAGGDNLELFNLSEEDLVISNRERLLKLYKEKYGKKAKDKLQKDISNLKFNSLSLAKSVRTSKIKMMITTDDTSVPTSSQWNLYYALGGPEARLYPTGHWGLVAYYFSIKEQLLKWLNKAFNPSTD